MARAFRWADTPLEHDGLSDRLREFA